MKKTKAIVIKQDGSLENVEIGDYKCLNRHVGCSTGAVVSSNWDRNLSIWIDDEGLFKESNYINPTATNIYGCHSPLVGNAVVYRVNDEGENIDLTEEDITKIKGKVIK
jgi:hypothetical protein